LTVSSLPPVASAPVPTVRSSTTRLAGPVGRIVGAQFLFGEPRENVGQLIAIERRGELRALGAGPQLALLEAIAEQQRQRIEQDRLAGAGFAGEHGEAAVELELERIDDDKVADRQQAQHRSVLRKGRR